MLARVAIAAVVCAAGCWTKTSVSGPPSWRTSGAVEVLPDGAWLVAALDLELDSPAQREREAVARRDPKAVRSATGGCQFPSTHFAVAMYGESGVVVSSRGGYHRRALLDCISGMAGDRGKVHATSIAGLPAIELRSPEGGFALAATDHGMVVGASSVPLLARTIAGGGSATADPKLEALVRDARHRGELWVAARVPRGSTAIASMLKMIAVDGGANVTAIVGAMRIQAPFRIDIALEVGGGGAARLASALEARLRALGNLLDPDLAPIVDAVEIRAEGNTVRIVGSPANVDLWKAFQGLLRTVANLKA